MMGANTYGALRQSIRWRGGRVHGAYRNTHVRYKICQRVSDGEDGQSDYCIREPENVAKGLVNETR